MAGIPFPALTRVYIQNLSGDVLTVNVTVTTTVAELKQCVHTLNNEYDAGRQRLFIQRIGDLEGADPIVLQNQFTLGQYGIFMNETLIYLLMIIRAPGDHIMSIDLKTIIDNYTTPCKYFQQMEHTSANLITTM